MYAVSDTRARASAPAVLEKLELELTSIYAHTKQVRTRDGVVSAPVLILTHMWADGSRRGERKKYEAKRHVLPITKVDSE